MRTDYGRKKDALERIFEKVLNLTCEPQICFEESSRRVTVERTEECEKWCSKEIYHLSQLAELAEIFGTRDVEIIPHGPRSSKIYISSVGRWPWEM